MNVVASFFTGLPNSSFFLFPGCPTYFCQNKLPGVWGQPKWSLNCVCVGMWFTLVASSHKKMISRRAVGAFWEKSILREN